MMSAWAEVELTPNAAAKMPWSSHVKRLVDLGEDVVRKFVERDIEHHRIAESDPWYPEVT